MGTPRRKSSGKQNQAVKDVLPSEPDKVQKQKSRKIRNFVKHPRDCDRIDRSLTYRCIYCREPIAQNDVTYYKGLTVCPKCEPRFNREIVIPDADYQESPRVRETLLKDVFHVTVDPIINDKDVERII